VVFIKELAMNWWFYGQLLYFLGKNKGENCGYLPEQGH
jgi:hypothetical protein